MMYRIVFEDAADGGVGAYLPDMPGVGVVAESRPEAVQMLDLAVRWHVDAMVSEGLPLPAPIEDAQEGEWSIVLERTFVEHISAGFEKFVQRSSASTPFWHSSQSVAIRRVERAISVA